MTKEYLTKSYYTDDDGDYQLSGGTILKSSFITGAAVERNGKVAKITFERYLCGVSYSTASFEIKSRLYYADGSYNDSDTVVVEFNGQEVKKITNTFTENLFSIHKFCDFEKIETIITNHGGSTASRPFFQFGLGYIAKIVAYFTEDGFAQYCINGEWKECEVYYGINNGWQRVIPNYGANGVWNST